MRLFIFSVVGLLTTRLSPALLYANGLRCHYAGVGFVSGELHFASSQAHKLTSSQAHWGTIAIAMLASLALACTGCDFQPEASAASLVQATGSNTSNGNELDLGIVFADRTGYVCLPLNRFGIQTADEIGALDSSCDCVRPTLVSYQLSKASTADALLLQFIPESAARDAIHPAWLEVHVTISLRSGETREVIANFLNTTAVDKEQAP